MPYTVGLLVGNLLLLQAAFCMAFGDLWAGGVLLLLWPVFRALGRWFYSS
jgi:hypothetical protein